MANAKDKSAENSGVVVTVESIGYTADGIGLLAYRQTSGDGDQRWMFNVAQLLAQNGMMMPEGAETEIYADTDEERDQIGTQLVNALVESQAAVRTAQNEAGKAFAEKMPKKKDAEEPAPEA